MKTPEQVKQYLMDLINADGRMRRCQIYPYDDTIWIITDEGEELWIDVE